MASENSRQAKTLTLQAKAAGVTMVASAPKLSTVMYSVPLISSVMMVRLVLASIVGRTWLSVKLLSLCKHTRAVLVHAANKTRASHAAEQQCLSETTTAQRFLGESDAHHDGARDKVISEDSTEAWAAGSLSHGQVGCLQELSKCLVGRDEQSGRG